MPGAASRNVRGEIERLPSGSFRVRVYAGVDSATKRRRYLTEVVSAGPTAQRTAEAIRRRLVGEVDQHRAEAAAGGGGRPRATEGTVPVRRHERVPGEITVAAIARQAGVSTTTVSKVLNGRPGVAPRTRQQVEAVLGEHRYRRPDTSARTASIEVVFHGMLSNLAIAMMQGVEQVCSAQNLSVGFTDVVHRSSGGRSWAHDLLARRPIGVIAVHLAVPLERHALLATNATPLVALDPTGEPAHSVPSVGATDWSGSLAAARHLLHLGHRRIATITGPADRLCAQARLDGIRAAMDAAGTPLDGRLIRVGQWFAFEDGLDHGRELLRLTDPPTAIMCGNDLQALGVYEAVRRAGRRIPDDLSVVGFDDISATRWCGPAMTTVRQPFAEMGAAAAKTVLSLAAGQQLPHDRVELPTTLIVRDSTAPPATR
ncbi:LacI family DNA-binding transcriptional regulator [Micromonospora sp. LOL_024]|uniref:LacI family DNA-binding transcriptional regulator n=1 Tax=Micromonospora sp. LOL_024 TaxID=3345412 RepID=UPI003A88982D